MGASSTGHRRAFADPRYAATSPQRAQLHHACLDAPDGLHGGCLYAPVLQPREPSPDQNPTRKERLWSMTNGFTFDGYTVRPATEKDRPYLQLQIDADPFHGGRMTADFFLKLQPRGNSWALENADGRSVFYFKTPTAARIPIQRALA